MSLNGQNIWVTRPQEQADTLSELIRLQQGRPIQVPLIEIKPVSVSEEQKQRIDGLQISDIMIFISINAVDHSSYLILNKELLVIGVGKTTAKRCEERGYKNVVAGDSDSESLLRLPELQSEKVNGRRIIIIRGHGGRELLASTLEQRGAKIEYLEVYQRLCPEYSHEKLKSLWLSNRPHIILITSAQSLNNLINVTTDEYYQILLQTPLVVFSQRIASYAAECGFQIPATVCREQSNQGLVQACIEYMNSNQNR